VSDAGGLPRHEIAGTAAVNAAADAAPAATTAMATAKATAMVAIDADARADAEPRVLRLYSFERLPLAMLLARYGMTLRLVAPDELIPGSYWGESEAGLIGDVLYARLDTPLHSVLHEACHYICMTPERRAALDRDAGGDHPEESAVCLLQVLLADALPGIGRERMLDDMDAWGYSFRLGSVRAWLAADADDAREWLRREGLTDERDSPTWRCRG
jgi:hypothetical protein